ncbi:TonB-dependent receptor [Novosphingobium sp. H3SJ31-1]|uniref:TonB-dependent receptor n=1 Tax=Novosphingobium album (ex Liu et al. 2023) TaxID=3031130 RepID=A0ABT5WMC6_9SPHN|nr:TonB-dependent receptor [Novosphingobium album (ex Liu et al. 2023)]
MTARRVEERLQDVPISITAFSQEQLDTNNVVAAKDLVAYTPSLSVNTRYGSDYGSFSIRGFTQEERTTASVGVYFADVVAPRNGGASNSGDGGGPGSFFDLQNVQVLKGPQGTLFGRNTTGGAVLLVPRKPSRDFEGYVEGSIGNSDMRRLQGVVNLPVNDTFRLRFGFDRQKREGYLRNISGIGPKDFADIDYFAARVSLVADLTPDLENYTLASYGHSTPHGSVAKLTDCFDGSVRVITAQFVCAQLDRERDAPFMAVSNYLADARQEIEQWQVINTTTWQASDTLTIKNIASYAEQVQDQSVDLFGLSFVVPATLRNTSGTLITVPAEFVGMVSGSSTVQSPPGYEASDQATFTEELQFQGRSTDGRLTWQTGAYFEKSTPLSAYGTQSQTNNFCTDSNTFQCRDIFGVITGASVGSVNRQLAKTTFRNIGLYAQASYDLTERLKVTAGLRYTWDKVRTEIVDKALYRFLGPDRDQPVRSCVDEPALTECGRILRQDSKAPTWLIGLDYKPNPDLLLYAKWARGYRQGSTSPQSIQGRDTYRPEKVDSYEAGVKATFRGAIPGTFNIAAFYNDFRDQQLKATFTGVPPYPSNLAIVNAGKSRIYGAEIEATVSPFDGFRLQASYAYLNSKLEELDATYLATPDPLRYTDGRGPLVGGALPFTPKHKVSATANYTLPLDRAIGEITLGGTFSYTARMFYQDPVTSTGRRTILGSFDDYSFIAANTLVNLNASWSGIMGSPVDAQFFMTNAFDKRYFTAHNISPAQGYLARYIGEPRMYGVRLRYSF